MNNEVEKDKATSKSLAWLWILLASIGGAIIFILAMILFQKWFGFEISCDSNVSIILAFVGIAVTFVVVSNYAQVKDVERKFEEKTKGIERMIGGIREEYSVKIHELEESNKKHIVALKKEQATNVDMESFSLYYSIGRYGVALCYIMSAISRSGEKEYAAYVDIAVRRFKDKSIKIDRNHKLISFGLKDRIVKQGKDIGKLGEIIDRLCIDSF